MAVGVPASAAVFDLATEITGSTEKLLIIFQGRKTWYLIR